MFKGENLQYLRRLFGYSQEKLARLLHTPVEKIRLYEANEKKPDFAFVNKLCLLFDVRGLYFYRETFVHRYQSPARGKAPIDISYSSKRFSDLAQAQSEKVFIEYLNSLINYLTLEVEVPLEPIITLRDQAVDMMKTSTMKREEAIKRIASLAREVLELEDESNKFLLFCLEKSGIFVFEKMLGTNKDVYSLWVEGARPYIFLRKYGDSAVQRNFDLAHELGHLLLHQQVEFSTLSKEEYAKIEDEANRFAVYFLLPEESFAEDMATVWNEADPDAYIHLKRKWDVSLYWLGYRAWQSGLISEEIYEKFYQSLKEKGYWDWEPLDEINFLPQPQKMLAIFDFIFNEEIVDLPKMLREDLLFKVDFLAKITGVDDHFFDRYKAEGIPLTEESRVIPFSRTKRFS